MGGRTWQKVNENPTQINLYGASVPDTLAVNREHTIQSLPSVQAEIRSTEGVKKRAVGKFWSGIR